MTAMPPVAQPLRLGLHVVVAVAIGVVAPFTGFAWPIALLTGIVIGVNEVAGAHGVRKSFAQSLARAIEVTGGVLAMLVAGAVIGGLIAFVIVVLAAFSERAAGEASPIDRGVARIVLFIGAAIGWIVIGTVLGVHVNLHFGA